MALEHACGVEFFRRGIVSKRKDSTYAGLAQMKNPACEAVRREAEEAVAQRETPCTPGASSSSRSASVNISAAP